MGCGNALQTAKEEYVHMRRENDEMRHSITRLKRKAECSAVQLSTEQQRLNTLNDSLALARSTLSSVGNILAGIRKQCFGGEAEELSPEWEVEVISQKVMDLVLSFQESALTLLEQLQQTSKDVDEFILSKDPQLAQWAQDRTSLKATLSRLWATRDAQSSTSDTLVDANQKLTSVLEEKQIAISMLSLQLSEKTQLAVSLQVELAQLEKELTSKGYVIANPASVSLSYDSENEIQEGSVSDEVSSRHSNSTIE